MPVTRIGPRCHRCTEGRPVWDQDSGLCWACHSLLEATGQTPAPHDPIAPLTRFDALVALGDAYPAEAREFSEELRGWLGDEAA